MAVTIDPKTYLGRAPERLSVKERRELRGWWMALEIYSPATTPLRLIEALGRTREECLQMLVSRGLDVRQFELEPVVASF